MAQRFILIFYETRRNETKTNTAAHASNRQTKIKTVAARVSTEHTFQREYNRIWWNLNMI